MNDHDLWTTFIAATPDEDPEPSQGCSGLIVALGVVLFFALVAIIC